MIHMNNKLVTLLLVVFASLIGTFPLNLFASKMPVVISIREEPLNPVLGYSNYYVTEKIMEIGSAADVIPPYQSQIGLITRRADNKGTREGSYWVEQNSYYIRTLSELSLGVYPGDSTMFYDQSHAYCSGWGYQPGAFFAWGSQQYLPMGCVAITPGSEWCKITTPEIELDHGTITLKEAEGSSASANVGVSCTTPTSVTFNLVTNDKYVYLDEGKSEISIDNKPLNTKIDLAEGATELRIKDLLTGVNSEGAHTGSSVLVMAPY